MQQAQLDMGYTVAGGADGIYGGGTSQAVSDFQAAHRLNVTGEADVNTQMAIRAAAAGTFDQEIVVGGYEGGQTPETKFALILDQADGNLRNYLDDVWKYTFDPYEGKGSISTGLTIGSFEVTQPEIDQILIELGLEVLLLREEGQSTVHLIPAVTVDSQGAYCPNIQRITLTRGSEICQLENAVTNRDMTGTVLAEHAYIPLTKEAADFLAAGGEIMASLDGKDDQYNIPLSNQEGTEEFLRAARGDISY